MTTKRMERQYIITLNTNMVKENVSLDFRLKTIDKARNSLFEEIK